MCRNSGNSTVRTLLFIHVGSCPVCNLVSEILVTNMRPNQNTFGTDYLYLSLPKLND